MKHCCSSLIPNRFGEGPANIGRLLPGSPGTVNRAIGLKACPTTDTIHEYTISNIKIDCSIVSEKQC